MRKGSEGKALSPRFTFGLYSAFLACRAMFFRSSLQAKFTVDTIFLRNEGGIFSLQNPATAEPPPSSTGLMWSHIPINNYHQLISCLSLPHSSIKLFLAKLKQFNPKTALWDRTRYEIISLWIISLCVFQKLHHWSLSQLWIEPSLTI